MAADNELLVLIYDNMQKILSQIKDTRIVIQTLANRTGELERAVQDMNSRTFGIDGRLEAVETALSLLNHTVDKRIIDVTNSGLAVADTVNTIRKTFDKVTNPGIISISNSHKETKDAVRELKNVHSRVAEGLDNYELRLAKAEDDIEKLLTLLLHDADRAQNTDTEASENDE